MIKRILPGVLVCLLVTAGVRGDELDDGLAAAKAQLLAGKVDDAATQLEALETRARAIVTSSPGDAHAQYILGMAAMYGGDDAAAKSALDMALRLEPKNVTYLLGRAEFASDSGVPQDAVKLLHDNLAANAKNLEFVETLGRAQVDAQQFADAQATFQQAADLAPRQPRLVAEVAECLQRQHKEEEALAAYRKALEIDPKYTLALINMAQIYQGRKDYDPAIATLNKVIEIDPNDSRSLARLVQVCELAGKIPERDAARDKIFALHKAGKNDAASYCREQFAFGKSTVLAFESFELTGPTAVRYAFNVVNADGKTVEQRISLGSYLDITAQAREQGKIKAGERMFHLDVYTDTGHQLLGMYTKEPTYEETRALVKDYLAGNLKPIPAPALGPVTTVPTTTRRAEYPP